MNGPALWGLLLDALGEPSAVMAGGCIRDFELGLEPKDYDIFVPAESKSALYDIAHEFPGLSVLTPESLNKAYFEESGVTGTLIGVIEGDLLDYPINIVARRPHLAGLPSLLESFDFGCVQACWSPMDGFTRTTAFTHDIRDRTATIMRDDTYSLSIARFARFDSRNSGVLRLVDPYAGSFDDFS
ncbi:hypothetical protein [Tsuneonella sp. HG222]